MKNLKLADLQKMFENAKQAMPDLKMVQIGDKISVNNGRIELFNSSGRDREQAVTAFLFGIKTCYTLGTKKIEVDLVGKTVASVKDNTIIFTDSSQSVI